MGNSKRLRRELAIGMADRTYVLIIAQCGGFAAR
jgi:hypothetical protein